MTQALVLLLTIASLSACFGESDNEKVRVNAYFYFPDNKEVYLGEYRGASACQSAAINYSRSKKISQSSWGYICCTIEKGSSCHRKIR